MTRQKVEFISAQEAAKRGIDVGSKAVKELAAKQKISITLPEEVVEDIRRQWAALDSSRPAEITFVVRDDIRARLRVAAYGYFTDTCCA